MKGNPNYALNRLFIWKTYHPWVFEVTLRLPTSYLRFWTSIWEFALQINPQKVHILNHCYEPRIPKITLGRPIATIIISLISSSSPLNCHLEFYWILFLFLVWYLYLVLLSAYSWLYTKGSFLVVLRGLYVDRNRDRIFRNRVGHIYGKL